MTVALYVLLAASALLEAAIGVSMVFMRTEHPLLSGVPDEVWAAAPGGMPGFVSYFIALACLAVAGLHVQLFQCLRHDREEAHTLLQAYGGFCLVGGILLFLAFGRAGIGPVFLLLDSLRGLLLLAFSMAVALTPSTVRELRLPRAGGSRVSRGRATTEARRRGRAERGRPPERGDRSGGRRATSGGARGSRRRSSRSAGGRPTPAESPAVVTTPPEGDQAPPERKSGRRSGRRRGGRGRRRGGRGTRGPVSGADGEPRAETAGLPRNRIDRSETSGPPGRPAPAAEPDAASIGPGEESAGEEVAGVRSSAIEYGGRRVKKGRYSTGALFRPRQKRAHRQRGAGLSDADREGSRGRADADEQDHGEGAG
jgi:hypothetical protein